MHHSLDSWPIHSISVPRCQSVIRFSDSRVTLPQDDVVDVDEDRKVHVPVRVYDPDSAAEAYQVSRHTEVNI